MASVPSLAPRLLGLIALLGVAVWLAHMPVPEPSRRLLLIASEARMDEKPPKLPKVLESDPDIWVMFMGAQPLHADRAALLAAPEGKHRTPRFIALPPGQEPAAALRQLQAELAAVPGLKLRQVVPVRRLQPGVCAMQQLGDELLVASRHFGGLGLLTDEATRSALAACTERD